MLSKVISLVLSAALIIWRVIDISHGNNGWLSWVLLAVFSLFGLFELIDLLASLGKRKKGAASDGEAGGAQDKP